MEKEMLNTKPPIYGDNKSLKPSLHTFDLPNLIEKMKHESNWERGELNSLILLKNPDKQIMLIALHNETKIKSYQSNDSVTFHIIEGKLKFHTRKESVTLDKGNLLTLNDNIKYSLTSKEETVLLLTIANGTLQPVEY
jgi:quercetin dioxygenase-like cupin family protein